MTVVGEPSAGTGTRNGATAPPSRLRSPSGETSKTRANSVASAGAGCPGTRETVTCTRGAPVTVSGDCIGGVVNCADWPGSSAVNAESLPLSVPSAPPRPGSEVIAAGLPPAGLTTTCGSPPSASGAVVSGAVPGCPG